MCLASLQEPWLMQACSAQFLAAAGMVTDMLYMNLMQKAARHATAAAQRPCTADQLRGYG
jgi:hypothetical protein